ncbi:transcriptional regulator NanR [Citrobacter rodentium]|uniref:HTH-type transcriptional repressor NanR n=2 Tax=Citrobacter rodentium TaxID=67825 RepID=NANR_CITRI|nr:transcriptional regulator NanR [Citrobacter rodentium]D2TP58.1 RecName: Full=HTH-type transcriptional repressor NanR [Citrobacter rodentium ICC168]KIQ50165.1 transcriptional regulator NanR [Citrobacter rodentium]QBY30856.1 transcriptional regulator NanR [Citrobacter rodentium]UHO31778.1 transcriptional regulator NanR [Citrobacter rodentium NBRC 105723 = DSM 16636]CBG91291.1 GntR-family transcriptional regulator [Citrobacter rodentium ICC168]HAT8012218.1 transcriptional regulator NanR [Citr
MKTFDSQAENSPAVIGRSLRNRPLARKKLSEMVEEELEQMIRRKEFGEGEQLPSERELMAFFNVGRPSVREALAALKRKGLVQINNGERARVSRPSADTIIGELSGMAKDFLAHPGGIAHFEQLRLFFESSLVRYAAENATDAQIDLLAKALEINSQSLDDNALFIRSDVDFHRVLAEIPGNPIFKAIHVALLDWLIAARPTVPDRELYEHNSVSYQQHIAIVDAIRQRDPDAADRALQTHLNSVSATWHALGQQSKRKK